jgi:hypothetical protein
MSVRGHLSDLGGRGAHVRSPAGVKQTSRLHAPTSAFDLGWVKTYAQEKCAELFFSIVLSPDNRRQSFCFSN